MRLRFAFAITIAAATMCVSTAAAGEGERFRTILSVDGSHDHRYGTRAARGTSQGYDFFGHVESRKSKCARGRKITLFRRDSGPDTRLGKDVGDSNGGWSVFVRGTPVEGIYYAKAAKLQRRNGDLCRPDQSEDFLFTIL